MKLQSWLLLFCLLGSVCGCIFVEESKDGSEAGEGDEVQADEETGGSQEVGLLHFLSTHANVTLHLVFCSEGDDANEGSEGDSEEVVFIHEFFKCRNPNREEKLQGSTEGSSSANGTTGSPNSTASMNLTEAVGSLGWARQPHPTPGTFALCRRR